MHMREAVTQRIEKTKFYFWAARHARTLPCEEALAIWKQVADYARETTTQKLLGKLPHILEKDKKEFWWNFPNQYPFMYGLGRTLKPASYLEIGTRYGYSMAAIILGAKDTLASVTSIDFQEYEDRSQDFAKPNVLSTGYKGSYEFFAGSSHDAAIKEKVKGKAYDLVFVDGDHSYEGALDDILHYWSVVRPGKYMIVDDVLWQVFSNGKRVLRAVKDALPKLDSLEYFEFIGAGVRAKHKPEYGIDIKDFTDRRTGLAAFYRGLVILKKRA